MTCSCRDMTTTKRMQDLFSSGRGDPQRNLPRGRINKTLTLPLSDLPPISSIASRCRSPRGTQLHPIITPSGLPPLRSAPEHGVRPVRLRTRSHPRLGALSLHLALALSPARLENQSRGRFASLVSSFVALGVRSGGWKSMMRGSDSARQVRRPSSAGNV